MFKMILLLTAIVLVPICLIGGVALVIHSGIGERIAAYVQWDSSAESRRLAFATLHHMTTEELLFGVSPQRIMDIAYRTNLTTALSDIENPWLLMLMNFGAIAFSFWLVTTLLFAGRLLKGQPLFLQFTVLAYFIIASTSNSFGRKDALYLIMTAAVVCASRSLTQEASFTPQACSPVMP